MRRRLSLLYKKQAYRHTDGQTDRQTNRTDPTSDRVEGSLIRYFSAYLLRWNHLKKIINFLLQPQWRIVSSWLPFCFLLQNGWAGTKHHPSSPISRSIRWRSAAQCRLLVVEFLPFWVHSHVSLCFSGCVAPPKKDPVLWKEPRSSGDIVWV